jgi:NAD(P)-dependent dehydrogenase (short-subunit alcohol dehydrogenase family)
LSLGGNRKKSILVIKINFCYIFPATFHKKTIKRKEVILKMMLDGKVAVVTGAGRGIGREVALLLAKEGAKVVVNDFGGREDGTGGETKVADDVVNEIRNAGGIAVANYDAVGTMTAGKRIIQTALDNFGKIDILVNNAGILRDRMVFNMTEEEWDAVITVHLKGTFACTRAAVPLMREQRSGRIINFTSTSGLIGNVGQANYAAAKMGIVGFTKVVALDMARYNVTANCISPFAWTRLIGTIPTETEEQKRRVEKLKKMSPADIAPLVAYLASDEAQYVTGQIFGVRGKEIFIFSQPRPVRSIHHSEGWTPARLAEMFKGTLGMHLVPLETSGQVFSYDPLV